MHHKGDLVIIEQNAHEFTHITSVGGDLYVFADFYAPNLLSVVGAMDVRADLRAPKLKSVGSDLYVREGFRAPNLKFVAGDLDVRASFRAPKLKLLGGRPYVYEYFSAHSLRSVGGERITYFKYLLNFGWPVFVTDNHIRIGCECYPKSCLTNLTDAQICKMDNDVLEFWVEHKTTILAM